MPETLAHANIYTEEDYYSLPENVRAELIGGQFYYMAAPSRAHQEILNFINTEINIYLRSKNSPCKAIRLLLPLSCSQKMTETWWNRISV